jgi:hypothetical protein
MAAPASRQELLDYCLRRLGHPVIEINIDDDQLSDRLDDAFQYFQDYHYDGVERIYLKHIVTASGITIAQNNAASYTLGETIIGQSSNAQAIVTQFTSATGLNTSTGNSIVLQGVSGTFTTGETIIGSSSQISSTVSVFTLGDIDKGYIDLDDSIIGVVRILPFSATNTGLDYMFDLRYQLRLNDLFDLLSTSIIYYQQVKSHLALIDMLLVGEKSFRFQRHQNKLNIDMRWGTDIKLGEVIMVECYKILNPNEYTDVYNDRFIKRYATALIKRQWGENLKKFEGIQMPGGVTLNGQKIFDEALAEIQVLENEMQTTYVEPPRFSLG